MDFITIPNCRLGKDEPYLETINIEDIVSFHEGRIDLSNGQFVATSESIYDELKKYLTRKGHTITKLGV